MIKMSDNPFHDWKTDEIGDSAILARLSKIERELQIQRHIITMLEVEKGELLKLMSRPEPKPTVVKASVQSIVSVACHICQNPTRNKVNGVFECKKHSIVSSMSELERRVLNDFLAGGK